MTAVVVSRLVRDAIDESFVLARLGYPDLTLPAWRHAARRQLDRSAATGGILIARDAAGRLNGLVLYSHSACIAAGPCVRIERLISFDVSSPRSVANKLVSEVMRLGHLAGCDSLSLVRPCRPPADTTTLVLASETSVACQMF
ncbi:hypothetical protein [Brevundimonas sp. UBA7534]|uniref:hypothetical protein n=1 Tax=Brevundimonas sp. UBA7534 TaxID=1946138 RepID=UPI0025BBAD7E|nr:hypothetical protein [Brevundimonas sp. UBA7534]